MRKPIVAGTIDKRDVMTAVKSLKLAPFRERFARTNCNAPDQKWKSPSGQSMDEYVRDQMTAFKREMNPVRLHHLHGGVFHKFDSATIQTVAYRNFQNLVVPTAQDLFHVYGPDRDNTKDWTRYYRYAWKEKGPHAIIYSSDTQIIREGRLECSSYSYSGQSSYAIVGAGMFFLPQFGDAEVSIRPYVQWLTSASFTGTESAPASAAAYLGIYVESWAQSGGQHYVDRDHWIPVWSQNTQGYMVGVKAGGAATVGDGLATEILAVTQRKYHIFVYVYIETSAAPQQQKNEQRFTRIDIEATVPYVVVEEKL